MHQSSSSSKTHYQKSSSAAAAWPDSVMIMQEKKKKQQRFRTRTRRSRSPFQDLNNGGNGAIVNTFSSSNDSCSNASNSSSIDAPKGCLRFFLSHSSSAKATCCSNSSRSSNNQRRPRIAKLVSTPNSAPNMRPAKENSLKRSIFPRPISQKFENVKRNPPKSGRNGRNLELSSGLNCSGISVNKPKSDCSEVKLLAVDKVKESDASNLTPLNKVATGSGLNLGVDDEKLNAITNTDTNSISSDTKTPPVQASVSPEIQCGSSMVSSTTAKTITPVCYAAGYVLSGVVDKRKCRPRGILTVGEAKPLDCFITDDESEKENTPVPVNSSPRISLLPLPTEASMHWLLSPCNEEDEEKKENSEEGSRCFQRLKAESTIHNFPASPLSGNDVFSPDLFDTSSDRSTSSTSAGRKTGSSMLSPTGRFMGPSLYGNTATAVNEDRSGKNLNFDCKLNSVADHLQMTSLSPKSHVSIWDPTSSSFQFDCLTTPSNSIDISRFQKILDDRTSWFSDSTTTENVSHSQMRISWREGLASRILEMDEFDSCRCLSDEEDDANTNGGRDDCLKFHCSPDHSIYKVGEQTSTNGPECTMLIDSGCEMDGKAKQEIPHQAPCSCAESISTDGGGLARSDDSDWTLCYKNQLFKL